MKIGAVQFKPFSGDVEANKRRHVAFIKVAIKAGANLIFFPELSITGYEPRLAKSLAVEPASLIFEDFQKISDLHNVMIGVGAPLISNDHVQIGMVWFRPDKPRISYKKQMLHPDETPYFVPGKEQLILQTGAHRIAPAICYESLQYRHSDVAADKGANIYLASVAKPSRGIETAMCHYPETARRNTMCVVMANCIGSCDDFVSRGNSAAWDLDGNVLARMDGASEGVLLVDIERRNASVVKVRRSRNI